MVMMSGEKLTSSGVSGNSVGKLRWDPTITNPMFVDLVDLLRCHNCKKLCYTVHNLSKCDHVICNECKKGMTSKKCPLCGLSTSEIRNDTDYANLIKDVRMLNQQYLKISFAVQQQQRAVNNNINANTSSNSNDSRVFSPPRPPVTSTLPSSLPSPLTSSCPVSVPEPVKGKAKRKLIEEDKIVKETVPKPREVVVEEKRTTRSTPTKKAPTKEVASVSESPSRDRQLKNKLTQEERETRKDSTDEKAKKDKEKEKVGRAKGPRKSVSFSQESESAVTPRKSPRTNKGNLMYTQKQIEQPTIVIKKLPVGFKSAEREKGKEKARENEKKVEKMKEMKEKEKEKKKEKELEKMKAKEQEKEKEKELEKMKEKKRERETKKEKEKEEAEREKEREREEKEREEREKAEREKEKGKKKTMEKVKDKSKEVEMEKPEEKEKRKRKRVESIREKTKDEDKETESELETPKPTNNSNNLASKGRPKRKPKEPEVSVDDDEIFVKPKGKGKRAARSDTTPEQTPTKRQRKVKETCDENETVSPGGRSASSRSTASNASSRPTSRILIASTLLTEEQKKTLEKFSKTLNIRTTSEFPNNVTHLVTKSDSNNRATRSMKYMKALLAHKWILNFDWITECLKAGELVAEERFELVGTTKQTKSQLGAPSRSRTTKKKLFSGLNFYFDGKFKSPDLPCLSDLTDLISSGDGTIINNGLRLNSALRKNVKVIIIKDEIKEEEKTADGSAKFIDTTELLNIITAYKMEDLIN